jgi:hypothetical protein
MMKAMGLFRLFRGRRLGLAVNVVAAAFLLASAAMPFGHHSVECHLKSLTHCASCTAGAGARLADHHGGLVPMPRQDAGPALAPAPIAPDSPSLGRTSDRAPPVNG